MPPVGFEPTISAGERPQAADLLRSWVRIPPGAWIFVCCECRVFSGRGLCNELITRPEESYRLCCVVVCDLETSKIGAPYIYIYIYIYDISSLRVKSSVFVTFYCFWEYRNIRIVGDHHLNMLPVRPSVHIQGQHKVLPWLIAINVCNLGKTLCTPCIIGQQLNSWCRQLILLTITADCPEVSFVM